LGMLPLEAVNNMLLEGIKNGKRHQHVIDAIFGSSLRESVYKGAGFVDDAQPAADFPLFLRIMRKVEDSGLLANGK